MLEFVILLPEGYFKASVYTYKEDEKIFTDLIIYKTDPAIHRMEEDEDRDIFCESMSPFACFREYCGETHDGRTDNDGNRILKIPNCPGVLRVVTLLQSRGYGIQDYISDEKYLLLNS